MKAKESRLIRAEKNSIARGAEENQRRYGRMFSEGQIAGVTVIGACSSGACNDACCD